MDRPSNQPAAPDRAYEDIPVGETASLNIEITESMVAQFAALTGDCNPLHTDEVYARATPLGGRVVHGMLIGAFVSPLVGMQLPGRRALIHSIELQFAAPVRIGDRLLLQGQVTEKHDMFRCLNIALKAWRNDDTLVARGSTQVAVLDPLPRA